MTITFIINALPQNYIVYQTLSKQSTDRFESYLIQISDTCLHVDLYYGCHIICSETAAIIVYMSKILNNNNKDLCCDHLEIVDDDS